MTPWWSRPMESTSFERSVVVTQKGVLKHQSCGGAMHTV